MILSLSDSCFKLSLTFLFNYCYYKAIGRVIRHKNDYGAIILIDERLSKSFLTN